MSKKICVVTPFSSIGGAEKIAVNLANYYQELGYEITLITFRGTCYYIHQVSKNIQIIQLKAHRIRYICLKLFIIINKIQPDSVLSVVRDANISVGLASFLYTKNVRIVFREANTLDQVYQMRSIKQFFYKLLMRLTYYKADLVIANSEDTAKDLINSNIRAKNMIVIGNPVLPKNYQQLANANLDHQWLTNPEYKTILTIGRLHFQKNHTLTIRAFSIVNKAIQNSRLVILGRGKEKESLISQAMVLGIEEYIDIIEFQSNPYPFYKHADVFVLSSLWEGFGNVIVEALACGTQVISTDCPGGPKMILENGKYGRLVPVNDIEAMSKEIISILTKPDHNNKSLRIKRGQEFSIENLGYKYLHHLLANT